MNQEVEGKTKHDHKNWTEFSSNNQYPLINPNASVLTSFNLRSFVNFSFNKNCKVILPFFDSQNIDLDIAATLSGIELFYYYTEGYGGFVRPRISTTNHHNAVLHILNKVDSMGPNFIPSNLVQSEIWS